MSMYVRLHWSEIKERNIEKKVSGSRHGCSKLYPRATPPLLGSRPRSFFLLLDPHSPLPFTLHPAVLSSPLSHKSAAKYPYDLHPPFQTTPSLITITARRAASPNPPPTTNTHYYHHNLLIYLLSAIHLSIHHRRDIPRPKNTPSLFNLPTTIIPPSNTTTLFGRLNQVHDHTGAGCEQLPFLFK